MAESKYEPKDTIRAVTIELECIKCGFVDFIAGNYINGEVFYEDDFKCQNCGGTIDNPLEVLKKGDYNV